MTENDLFENALLGLLCPGPVHGYELALHFDASGDLAAVGRLGKSQVYALLKSLEGHGFVEARLHEGVGGPPRRVLSITRPGRERFADWVRRPVRSIRALRVEFVLKLYFFEKLKLDGLDGSLKAQAAALEERLAELRTATGSASGVGSRVLSLQEKLVRAGLEWVSEQSVGLGPDTESEP